ncbi:uncharacterized protein LOC134247029 isoform X2 [Saccostrea cucullata]|uniref:uncharacterized protein LOC134247029 isoform X2 n=1 Tax=Saccostrea cuccullata TaxID=36930 RepID=UPI002ED57258
MSGIVTCKQKSVIAQGLENCRHISHVTSDLFWISDRENLILMNTAGDDLFHLADAVNGHQVHSLNSDGDLIYIDDKNNINKYSMKNISKGLLVKCTKPWNPRCVFSSHYNGDLLVGMFESDSGTAKVNRFNLKGEIIHNIEFDNNGKKLYSYIRFITENHNGDVIVSDFYMSAVVVTDRNGRHRFSYKGYPPGTGSFRPGGICTDSLSRILVCDPVNHTVHDIDKDGNFLSMILTLQQGIYKPLGLSLDEEKSLIRVGSEDNNTVDIFKWFCKEFKLERCKNHTTKEAETFCVDCEVAMCENCTRREEHSGHCIKDIHKIQVYPLLKIKCKKHPTNKPTKFCVDCDVPVCLDCIISKEHIFHFVKGFPLRNAKCEYHKPLIITKFCIDCDEPLCDECSNSNRHTFHSMIDVLQKTGGVFRKGPGNDSSNEHVDRNIIQMMRADEEQYFRLNSFANIMHKFTKGTDEQESISTETRGAALGVESRSRSYFPFARRQPTQTSRENSTMTKSSRDDHEEDRRRYIFDTLALKFNEMRKDAKGAFGGKYERDFPDDSIEYQQDQRERKFSRENEGITRLYTKDEQGSIKTERKEEAKAIDPEIQTENLLQHMKTKMTRVRHARGIVVGCTGAGKTTLLYRLMGRSLKEIKEIESTLGLQVYEHIFTVQDKSFQATDHHSHKPLIRIPISSLKKNENDLSDKKTMMDKDNFPKKEDVDDFPTEMVGSNLEVEDYIAKLPVSGDESNFQKCTKIEISEELGDVEKCLNLPTTNKCKVNETTITNIVSNTEQKTLKTQVEDIVSKTLSPEVIRKILDAQENEISISMIDFAGQFVYYASHQIYMRSKAFYILVMDMTKDFEEVVSRKEGEQTGSVFSTWKYKDYVEFWLNSICSFGGPKVPVLVVATHAEGKTEDDIEEFFQCLWRSLPKTIKSWLSSDTEFAFGLLYASEEETAERLQILKNSIVDLVSHTGKLNTKFEVPSSWALLEHLLQNSEKPIISCHEIKDLNEQLPEEYRLECNKEIPEFLSFFHDHGLLLYFEGEATCTHAILDIQWFSDAFAKLVADKKHINKVCRRELIEEWGHFNQTGELSNTLVDALWKGENTQSYQKYKKELMAYMESLQMLVSIGETDKAQSWYVPCMNKTQIKTEIIKPNLACSSILCFRFTSFAMFVFYRLVAYCMIYPKWHVVPDKKGKCLFQTVAMFEYKNHTVLLGICEKDIQLQIMTNSSEIDTNVSYEIGITIHKAIEELTKTFFEDTHPSFQKGYKCQKIFCDQNDKSFTPEEELCKLENEEIQCSCCPMEEKHTINIPKTRSFWEKAKEGSPRKSCTYPFSKRASQKDALTSHLKAEVIRSVGLIYVDGHPVGTGFRVGEKYIMTCLHVIKKIIQGPLDFIRFERVYIQFERMIYLQNTDERKIFHFEPSIVYKHEGFDVALLELKKQEIQFPPPLTLFGANCLSSEEVHLIGHPGGAQMKEDSEVYPSVIEPNNDVDKYIKELSDWSREKFMNNVDYYSRLRELPRKILFHTTFDQGSSGSPGILIRNHKPCVVLIVAGGVPSVYYEDGVYVEPEKRVEFGYALRDVFDEMQMDGNDKKLSSEIFKEWIS